MYISSFLIKNYKSYLKTETTQLKPGFNLFIGKNNVGKTSLLEALSTKIMNKPHLSKYTIPSVNYNHDRTSIVNLTIGIQKITVNNFIKRKAQTDQLFLLYNDYPNISKCIEDVNSAFNKNNSEVFINIDIGQNGIIYANLFGLNNTIPPVTANASFLKVRFDKDIEKSRFTFIENSNVSSDSSIWVQLAKMILLPKIYCFKAERFNVGKYKFGHDEILKTNAENLPEVLNFLQSNPKKFQRFNDYINRIFPEIYQIAIRPLQNNELEILTWTIDPLTERQDLAIPLSESGTGLGQVLAMLYVVLEKEPQVIIIDELQSFLHPGAVRKLIEIFKQNSHHQYIIATHSPTVISACNPDTITLIHHEGNQTILKPIDKKESSQLNEFLNDIGARLSDVFGADNIIWVEGATEEKCIPLIIEKIIKRSLMGTSVLAVLNTGDLEGRDKKRIYEIYNSLSKSNSLMPPAIGFLFDREGKTDNDILDLEKKSNNLVKFLNKRMYENYLINHKAICVLLNSYEGIQIEENEILEWIENNKKNKIFWKEEKKFTENWKNEIHGAEFLKKLFSELTNQRVTYRKTEHSLKLTQWIIENSKEDLNDITELLNKILTNEK